MSSNVVVKLLTALLSIVIGVVYGAAGTVAHAATIEVPVIQVLPIGLIIAGLGAGALILSIRLLTGERFGAFCVSAAMLLTVILLSGQGPGGSVLVPASPLGVAWPIVVTALATVILAWPDMSKFRSAPVKPVSTPHAPA